MEASPATTVAMRSDSFTRSSAASRSSLVPSAAAMAIARAGSSSISSATRSPPSLISCSRLPPRTIKSPTGSGRGVSEPSRSAPESSAPEPAEPSCSTISMSAPMSRSTSIAARRDGLMPTPTSRSSASGWIAAATSQGIAAERSPGTSSERGAGRAGPWIVVTVPWPPSGERWRSMGTPIQASRRSVWSRVGPATVIRVSPSAESAARQTAPRSCALGTGRRWSIARRERLPRIRSGARP